ncbi:MAG: hypothetical protein GY719_24535 [bacterium]|nr:hypothetical protein [bacterium]
MKSLFEAWRRHLWLWVLPAAFCILNLLVFAFYNSAFAGKVETLESRHRTATERLTALEQEREVIEEFLVKVGAHQQEVDGLYATRFETEAQRFTRAVQEVKTLARQAGLKPTSFGYPKKDFGDQGLVQRNINFSVNGTYDQLRTFINFLELSDHFVTLNSVTLGDSGEARQNPNLGINLAMSTIFSTREIAPRPAEVETGAETDAETEAEAEEPTT